MPPCDALFWGDGAAIGLADFAGGVSGFFGYGVDFLEDLEAIGDEAVAESVGDPDGDGGVFTGGF